MLIAFVMVRRSRGNSAAKTSSSTGGATPLPSSRPHVGARDLFWDHARPTVTLSSTRSNTQWDEPPAGTNAEDLERGSVNNDHHDESHSDGNNDAMADASPRDMNDYHLAAQKPLMI